MDMKVLTLRLAVHVLPIALGWGVQRCPWCQVGYHLLVDAQQQPEVRAFVCIVTACRDLA